MLSCDNISKTYRRGIQEIEAVRNISLDFQKGIHIITGKSGSGKTTLLKMLGGILTPDRGEVRFEGQNIYVLGEEEQAEIRGRKFSYIFQFFQLIPEYTVYDNIALPLYIRKEKKIEEKIRSVADALSIRNLMERMPDELSGGQQQRTAIGRSLVSGAKVIFADEPTGNLDRETSTQIMNIFTEMKKDKTIIMVTHDLELLDYADYVYHMEDGRIQRRI